MTISSNAGKSVKAMISVHGSDTRNGFSGAGGTINSYPVADEIIWIHSAMVAAGCGGCIAIAILYILLLSA